VFDEESTTLHRENEMASDLDRFSVRTKVNGSRIPFESGKLGVSREQGCCNFDLLSVQEVRWEKGRIEPKVIIHSSMGNIHLGTDVCTHKRIISAV
jgi:hypothetical protein